MATVELTIAGRRHELACRDGEEAHLRGIAAMVDAKANEAARSMGGMSEARQMLFAALMMADELNDARAAAARAAAAPPETDPAIIDVVEWMAGRIEQLSALIDTAPSPAGAPPADPVVDAPPSRVETSPDSA
ncbi:cell division protein ZapA [Sphingomonas solaris]|uniref:Cell division protein ZapA n=1 Tax=Alterirhizorhabdus solaris TaxID=2529389 RepID=A0A558R1L7_9SPHN|nr:cell division protein ZapA [Sphingomonas solaris]TVV73274.1 cell division protein ZapA [Sphingomonas solaris]